MKTSLLAVLGKDMPGIIAAVTGILYETRCNLEDVSMTVLEGEFAMMVVVSYDPSKKAAADKKLEALCRKTGLSFFWKEFKGAGSGKQKSSRPASNLYVISAIGRDRTGIVYHVSRELAAAKLNIQDLNSKILSSGKSALYAMVLEVQVPRGFDCLKLEKRLKQTAAKLKIDLTLKPVEQLEF